MTRFVVTVLLKMARAKNIYNRKLATLVKEVAMTENFSGKGLVFKMPFVNYGAWKLQNR